MNENDPQHDVQFCDIAPAIEFMCWIVVAIAPILRLINGPAVTDDQFVIQVSLFSLALVAAISMRIYSMITR